MAASFQPVRLQPADRRLLRPVLLFQFCNTVHWQIALGAPMVMLAQRLGASPFQVGLAYSFLYLLTPVQVLATALLPAWGYKRLTLGGWGIRSVGLLVPLVLAWLRPAAPGPWAVGVLVGSVGFFCLFRSIGLAALTSWLYALIPARLRVDYFTREQFLAGLSSSATQLLGAGLYLTLSFYPATLVLYIVALLGSGLSYYALRRLPDVPYQGAIDLPTVLRESPRRLLAPGPFRRYLWLSAGWMALVTPIPPFVAYYLLAVEGASSGFVMQVEFARYLSMGAGAWIVGRTLPRWGYRAHFGSALAGLAGVGGYWLLHLAGYGGGHTGLILVSVLLGVAQVTWVVVSADHVPRVTSGEQSALLVALFGAATAFTGGLAPVLWGPVLRTAQSPGFSVRAFEVFFGFILVALAGLAWRLRRSLATG